MVLGNSWGDVLRLFSTSNQLAELNFHTFTLFGLRAEFAWKVTAANMLSKYMKVFPPMGDGWMFRGEKLLRSLDLDNLSRREIPQHINGAWFGCVSPWAWYRLERNGRG
jgi:hypothetical protein